jgi:peptide/nickel transport system permease protein
MTEMALDQPRALPHPPGRATSPHGDSSDARLFVGAPSRLQPERRPRRRRRRLTLGGAIGLALVVLLIGLALLGPALLWLLDLDPTHQDLRGRLAPPVWAGGDWSHPFGTNALGQDLFARVVTGARVSLLVGGIATLVAGAVGSLAGAIAGYAGGRTDRAVGFLADAQLALPFVVVAIAVTAAFGNSARNVVLVLAITGWVGYARIVRLQTLSLRTAPFVEAAWVAGAGPGHVLRRHLLPNLTTPILVVASQQVAALILFEAALSYLGLGLPGETITWGGMVADGRDQLLSAAWVSAVPGGAIVLTVLGFNLLGDWLVTVLSPDS